MFMLKVIEIYKMVICSIEKFIEIKYSFYYKTEIFFTIYNT